MKLDVYEDLPRHWSGGPTLLVRGPLPDYVDRNVVAPENDTGAMARFVAHAVVDIERFGTAVSPAPVEHSADLWYAPSAEGAWYLSKDLTAIAHDSTQLSQGSWRVASLWRPPAPGKASVVFGLVDHQGVCAAIVGPHRGPQHDPLAAPTDSRHSL